ncbi:MAG: hypothetical protein DRJ56_01435 [Thermoprotei archaeon]|nr:MAG: hypothetical protein DRJ56_01435 [Thermoprotei archaeon]
MSSALDFRGLADEAAKLLSELIRVDTTNPPGNELPAAQVVADYLRSFGLEPVVVESEEGRGNVIVRLPGSGEGPSLLLLSHLDVVPADPSEWSFPPFSGEIKDGFVLGRGAVDCKGLVAVEAAVMRLLAGREDQPVGDVIFAATADEEKGGVKGVAWLLENRPELLRAEYVINEGGGVPVRVKDRLVYTVQVAEKGVFWLKLRFKGRPAHASVPWLGDNAIAKASEAVRRIESYRPPATITPVVKTLLEAVGSATGSEAIAELLTNPDFVDLALDVVSKEEGLGLLVHVLKAMVRDTMAPTMVKGGLKENVVAPSCELVVDCRLLPGRGKEELLEALRQVLVGLDYDVEFVTESSGTESPMDTPLYRAIEDTVHELVPGAAVAPFMSTGGTDSRHLRLALGSVCYGFWPTSPESTMEKVVPLMHGVDERVSVRDLEFAIRALYGVVDKLMYGQT